MKRMLILISALCFLCVSVVFGQTKVDALHGDELYSYRNFHSGNQIRTTFYNEGYVGHRTSINPDDIGEWPINSGHNYINLIPYFMLSEVKDTDGFIRHISSEANGIVTGNDADNASADSREDGSWQCNAPLPGFANPEVQRIAMSHQSETWPTTWPDKFEDAVDPGWPNSWNGYFGKNMLNADQESYYLFDDYQNDEFSFFPDTSDLDRRGLGLRGTVRGFQWSNVLVEDVLFQLVDIKNIGTYDHSKMDFGIMSGPVFGRSVAGNGDGSDDAAQFDLPRRIGWHFDEDDIGDTGWTPVGCQGFAYYESPGNPFDGIDDDDDAIGGTGKLITEELFAPRTINVGDNIVIINYTTFERTVTTMPAEGVTITYLGNSYHWDAGTVFEEIPANLIDDNLNGIIDESNGYVYGEPPNTVENYLFVGRKYIDYYTNEGKDNILIDERRDDGIDNDGSWNPLTDDVGLDGVANTGDFGESDGKPTSGWQPVGVVPGTNGKVNKFGLVDTNLPGEPHIDKTDIEESDMIGLTAFNIFIWGNPSMSNDEGLWQGFLPGFLNDYGQFSDTDLMLGSGYFPLMVGSIERFSLGIIFGESMDDLFTSSDYAKKTYEENYNFAKAPPIPTLTLIPGNNRVTLIWNDIAEGFYDPITGYDFEGYRIYRSTDPGWNDMAAVTDGQGYSAFRKPLAQFDLDNGLVGFSPVHVRGIEFYLGDDTGIVRSFVDSTAKNGFTYYYAVTAFDHGGPSIGVAPSECSKYLSINQDGSFEKGRNVGVARPEAPAAGFVPANIDSIRHTSGTSTALIGYEIVDPTLIKDKHTYRITFSDTLVDPARNPNLRTTRFNLIDITNTATPDTVLKANKNVNTGDIIPLVDGFKLQMSNLTGITLDSVNTKWNRASVYGMAIRPFKYSTLNGIPVAGQYRIEFGEIGIDTSVYYNAKTKTFKDQAVNYKVYDTSVTPEKHIAAAFWPQDGTDGVFTAFTSGTKSDRIVFLDDSLAVTWMFELDTDTNDSLHVNPIAGDVAIVRLKIPFLAEDVYEFTTYAEVIDKAKAKQELDKIKVVPNPYIVANSWEPLNPYASGRGPREMHFTHLPEKCTIRIFNIRGQLVRELEHDSPALTDGTEIWDMQTKDNLDIAYGVYIYHVDAGELGEIVGKFAVIK